MYSKLTDTLMWRSTKNPLNLRPQQANTGYPFKICEPRSRTEKMHIFTWLVDIMAKVFIRTDNFMNNNNFRIMSFSHAVFNHELLIRQTLAPFRCWWSGVVIYLVSSPIATAPALRHSGTAHTWLTMRQRILGNVQQGSVYNRVFMFLMTKLNLTISRLGPMGARE